MKRSNGTLSIYKFIDDFPSYKPPFIGDLPVLHLITGGHS